MQITSTTEGGRLRLSLSGELDHHSAGDTMQTVERRLMDEAPRDLVLDLGRLSFMDSSGIAIILKAYKLMNASGGRLWVENVPQQPMRVLEASGIERLVNIA